MPSKRKQLEGAEGWVPQDPRDMAKAIATTRAAKFLQPSKTTLWSAKTTSLRA
jgi:hypothetical protein